MSAVAGLERTPEWQPEPAGPLMGVRAFAVVMGGPLVLIVAAIASAAVSLRALVRRHAPPPFPAAGVAATVAYARLLRPLKKTWGARPGEAEKDLPGDETVPDPGLQQTRAITLLAPSEEVWSWLAQLGQDCAGFYTDLRTLADAARRGHARIRLAVRVAALRDGA